ncbi:DUF3617 domain-containing protein [Sphingosinicella soli]|uniref:DUF3617 family protein n=1 Tax=Sphingosinicella soli TaxID=333708 RepID=A0A7W7F7I2_9SPHN|nr:DUF3617 family protein [Sphingosinicella soli]MBB4633486.1 hypothetical protein [Sphingosinicella soli]
MLVTILAAAVLPAGAHAAGKSLWTTTGAIVSVNGPGVDAATKKLLISTPINHSVCAIKAPGDSEVKAAIGAAFGTCKYSRFTVRLGRVEAAAKCTGGSYGDASIAFVGTYNGTFYKGSNTSVFKTKTGDMTVRSNVNGRITGTC